MAHTTYLHEATRLLLDTLGMVDDDDDAIHSGERAVGIFGEVLVTWGIEDVDFVVLIVEAHDTGCHGDTTLTLYLHKVTSSTLLDLVALDGSSYVDGASVEEELLGEGRFTCIWVRYDGKGATTTYFFF